ncbi:hypothetical protein [Lichenicoccus roseus]|uniref:hypothetical protein n=1 Tax=Lichenicoccus roseus TaxID=2683649 RepID=UPI001486113F|nr:hypothetical protein [Lichenicoccus roseus]
MRACLVALALPNHLANAYQLPPRTPWPVQRSIARICDRLRVLPYGSALTSFLPDLGEKRVGNIRVPSALASTLIAGLELARDGELTLDQKKQWNVIQVGRQSLA